MASAGSDDEQQPPQQNKYWWCACFPWLSGSPRAVSTQEQPQQEPLREEAPGAAGQDTPRGPEEENQRREPERGVEEKLNTYLQKSKGKGKVPASDQNPHIQRYLSEQLMNTDLQSSKSKDKEKEDEVLASGSSSDQNTIGPGIPSGDNWRTCVVCLRSMDLRDMTNDVRVHKWSEVCNHHVCEECIADALNSNRKPEELMEIRDEDPVEIRDEDQVECPVQGCTHMLTAAQCRDFISSGDRAEAGFRRLFGIA